MITLLPFLLWLIKYLSTCFYMKLVAALLRIAKVTAGLAESNGSIPPGIWLTSPAGWLPRTGTLCSVIEYGLLLPFTCSFSFPQQNLSHFPQYCAVFSCLAFSVVPYGESGSRWQLSAVAWLERLKRVAGWAWLDRVYVTSFRSVNIPLNLIFFYSRLP